MPRTRVIAVLAGALCASATFLAAPAGGAERYPVWWTPDLELESLDRIDERFARPWDNDLRMHEGGNRKKRRQDASSCAFLWQLLAAGYSAAGGPEYQHQRGQIATCRTLELIKTATPARESFVRDFELTPGSFAFLPALDVGWLSDVCSQSRGKGRLVPFTDYLSRHGVTVLVKMSRDTTRVETEIIGYIMSIDARADIDGDGLEDLLVYVDHYYTQGTGGGTNFVHSVTRYTRWDALGAAYGALPLQQVVVAPHLDRRDRPIVSRARLARAHSAMRPDSMVRSGFAPLPQTITGLSCAWSLPSTQQGSCLAASSSRTRTFWLQGLQVSFGYASRSTRSRPSRRDLRLR